MRPVDTSNYEKILALLREDEKEIARLRQRAAELEAAYAERRRAHETLHEKYKERGERMKEIRMCLTAQTGLVEPYRDWFDPKTGEPL